MSRQRAFRYPSCFFATFSLVLSSTLKGVAEISGVFAPGPALRFVALVLLAPPVGRWSIPDGTVSCGHAIDSESSALHAYAFATCFRDSGLVGLLACWCLARSRVVLVSSLY